MCYHYSASLHFSLNTLRKKILFLKQQQFLSSSPKNQIWLTTFPRYIFKYYYFIANTLSPRIVNSIGARAGRSHTPLLLPSLALRAQKQQLPLPHLCHLCPVPLQDVCGRLAAADSLSSTGAEAQQVLFSSHSADVA